MTDRINELKENYEIAKQELADVSKGGKDHSNCSFMDISIRVTRLENVKKEYIVALGEKEFLNEK